MRELLKRSITGFLYVISLLAAVFLSSDAYDFLFMTFALICIYEFKKIIKLSSLYIFIAFLALWWFLIYLIPNELVINILMFLTITTNIVLIKFLYNKEAVTFLNYQKFLIALFYLGGGFIFLTMIPYQSNHFSKFLIIGIFIMIWVNDSFAYLVGKTIGKTKLFKSVSPKKTIEGSLGGLVFTFGAAYILHLYNNDLTLIQWLILAAVIVITGSLGDLVESKFKRLANVKDSGAILPGHGGLLDRLDSLVFAAPFAYLTLQIFNYVS
jgi:phosphatidate cytidylyltransferase